MIGSGHCSALVSVCFKSDIHVAGLVSSGSKVLAFQYFVPGLILCASMWDGFGRHVGRGVVFYPREPLIDIGVCQLTQTTQFPAKKNNKAYRVCTSASSVYCVV